MEKWEEWIEFKRGADEQNVGEEGMNENGKKWRRAKERWTDDRMKDDIILKKAKGP